MIKLRNIGEYRTPVELQKVTKEDDEFGNPIETWKKYKTIWVKQESLSGRAYFDAKQSQSEITGTLKTRYIPDILDKKGKLRIKKGEKVIEIEEMFDSDGTKREIEIMIKERDRDE